MYKLTIDFTNGQLTVREFSSYITVRKLWLGVENNPSVFSASVQGQEGRLLLYYRADREACNGAENMVRTFYVNNENLADMIAECLAGKRAFISLSKYAKERKVNRGDCERQARAAGLGIGRHGKFGICAARQF